LPEILEICLNEEEASILLALPGTPNEVAKKLDKKDSHVDSILDELFKTGFVVRRSEESGLTYGLVNDLWSMVLPDKRVLEKLEKTHMRERFLDLWDQFYEREFVHQSTLTSSDEYQARIIPVEITIPMKWGEVLPHETASKILEDARTIAVTECACRTSGRRCDNPTDVCILLEDFADLFIERGVARKISKDEALAILGRCEELGLVHQLNNTEPKGYQFLCNCCSCCCALLRGMISLGKDTISLKSRYLSTIDQELCDGCDLCVDRCQFEAIVLEDSKAMVNEEKCFGCGLCASTCPTNAIHLVQIRGPEHIKKHLLEAPEDIIDDLMISKE